MSASGSLAFSLYYYCFIGANGISERRALHGIVFRALMSAYDILESMAHANGLLLTAVALG